MIQSTSAIDFNLNLSNEENSSRIKKNVLVEANIILRHLANVLYQPPASKNKMLTNFNKESQEMEGKKYTKLRERKID